MSTQSTEVQPERSSDVQIEQMYSSAPVRKKMCNNPDCACVDCKCAEGNKCADKACICADCVADGKKPQEQNPNKEECKKCNVTKNQNGTCNCPK